MRFVEETSAERVLLLHDDYLQHACRRAVHMEELAQSEDNQGKEEIQL